jgi:RNA polymerase sigma-70 factor (ECF subfamily)
VFGVVARRLGDFVETASLKTWLFAITQRVAANHRRTQRRKQWPVEPLVESVIANAASPEEQAEAARAAALIESFAAGLDDGHRAVLVLALIEQVLPRHVAVELGIPLNTVYSRMRSVREGLRAFLLSHGVST